MAIEAGWQCMNLRTGKPKQYWHLIIEVVCSLNVIFRLLTHSLLQWSVSPTWLHRGLRSWSERDGYPNFLSLKLRYLFETNVFGCKSPLSDSYLRHWQLCFSWHPSHNLLSTVGFMCVLWLKSMTLIQVQWFPKCFPTIPRWFPSFHQALLQPSCLSDLTGLGSF